MILDVPGRSGTFLDIPEHSWTSLDVPGCSWLFPAIPGHSWELLWCQAGSLGVRVCPAAAAGHDGAGGGFFFSIFSQFFCERAPLGSARGGLRRELTLPVLHWQF